MIASVREMDEEIFDTRVYKAAAVAVCIAGLNVAKASKESALALGILGGMGAFLATGKGFVAELANIGVSSVLASVLISEIPFSLSRVQGICLSMLSAMTIQGMLETPTKI